MSLNIHHIPKCF